MKGKSERERQRLRLNSDSRQPAKTRCCIAQYSDDVISLKKDVDPPTTLTTSMACVPRCIFRPRINTSRHLSRVLFARRSNSTLSEPSPLVADLPSQSEATDLSPETPPTQDEKSKWGFADLLRNSNLVRSGMVAGKTVPGVVTAVVGKNLYIDFGGKFHAVVTPDPHKTKKWRAGAEVWVRVNDLEHTGHFLGSSKHVSLLEASVDLVESGRTR